MELVVRAVVIYVFLWVVVRGIGKRSLAELTPLELVMIVVLGDLVQQAVTQDDMSLGGAMVAVSVFVVLTLVFDALSRRWDGAKAVIEGSPVIVLESGEPLWDRLESERLSISDLKEAARIHGYADLADLQWAILETDGQFSFIARDGGAD